MISAEERQKMLAVHLCGERVLRRLEAIGVEQLADLRERDPWELMHEVNLEAGRPIWHAPLAVSALQNLIDAAGRGGDMLSRPAARERVDETRG